VSPKRILQFVILEPLILSLQWLVVLGGLVVASLPVWWLTPLTLTASVLVVYGVGVIAPLVFQWLLPRATSRQQNNDVSSDSARDELLNMVGRRSSGIQPLCAALRRLAHLLAWPALLVHRLGHAHDYPILRDRFDIPVSLILFPSDVVLAAVVASAAVSLCWFSDLSWPAQVAIFGCLVDVTARHLAYVFSPESLTTAFRQSHGNVFLKLTAIGIFDLATLVIVYACWTAGGWMQLSLQSLVNSAVDILTPQQPVQSLIGFDSPVQDRIRTVSSILYYAGVARVIWPPKNLQRTQSDLITIGLK